MSDVDETIKRLSTRKGVEGIVILNEEGLTIRSTLDADLTKKYASQIYPLVGKSKTAVEDVDPENEMTFLRIRTKKHELMISPDKEYTMIVVQNHYETQ
ncbi:hypothetical protein BGW37DRAFT_492123 [Umbelopsis sp. PMI_123]|nr:hypothetical protein BGW37DRAFT_492123 [Umbelopsis sp. PMI_123]